MNNNRNSVPILFLIFNRPATTRCVFESIRQARPEKLFIAADGPRPEKPTDEKLCEETRHVVSLVDWDCEVQTLFREKNLGCKRAVSSAIDWFFEHVEEGVILEDDCVPGPSFFRFCRELLQYYRDESRVMMIGGNSSQLGRSRTLDSYYFSAFSHIWGWATWRRAWQLNDPLMKTWPDKKGSNLPKEIMLTHDGVNRINSKLDSVYSGSLNSWAYAWQYSCWIQKGLCIVPEHNLVTNIGFGNDATHIKERSLFTDQNSMEISFPLTHPDKVTRNRKADLFIVNHLYLNYPLKEEVGWFGFQYSRLRKRLPVRVRRVLDPLFNFDKRP